MHTIPAQVLIRIINNNVDLNYKQFCTGFAHIVINLYTGSGFTVFYDEMYLLGPLNFTIVNFKKRPVITSIVSYDLGSCPFTIVINFPTTNKMHVIQYKRSWCSYIESNQKEQERLYRANLEWLPECSRLACLNDLTLNWIVYIYLWNNHQISPFRNPCNIKQLPGTQLGRFK